MSTRDGGKVLIVEDHEGLAELLVEELSDAGLQARSVASAEAALSLVKGWHPDIVVSDLRLPGMDGLELLHVVKRLPTAPEFLIITAFGTVAQAVEALKAGADDFLTKPLDLEQFMHRMRKLMEMRRLRVEVAGYREAFAGGDFHGMAGRSEAMRHLFDQIQQIARAQGPVLILGESGTGKEMVARAVHVCSSRADEPFVAVNCAGVPETLMESEFFGHAAGAFTGANRAREGFFRQAEGGTLLLDEIAEMPPGLQSKLLRILQDGKVRPVGGSAEQQVDIRILAATHQDPAQALADGRLREDLYYRLETFTLRVPPLRERDDDVELLAQRFLTLFANRMEKPVKGFDEAALGLLRAYPFPGNVRELRNAVERAVTFCNASRIQAGHLPTRIRKAAAGATAVSVTDSHPLDGLLTRQPPPPLVQIEQAYIQHVLEATAGNKKRAAELLGITRKTLYSRLAR